VVEHGNLGNGCIHYRKDSELPGADRYSQETGRLALHLTVGSDIAWPATSAPSYDENRVV
jgi:hypothetical protein